MTTIPRRHVLAGLLAAPFLARAQAAGLEKITVAGWSKPITEITPLLVDADKGFYRAQGIDLGYVPGAGSAIFFHLAKVKDGVLQPTEGCVALVLADMLEVLARVTPDTCMTIDLD